MLGVGWRGDGLLWCCPLAYLLIDGRLFNYDSDSVSTGMNQDRLKENSSPAPVEYRKPMALTYLLGEQGNQDKDIEIKNKNATNGPRPSRILERVSSEKCVLALELYEDRMDTTGKIKKGGWDAVLLELNKDRPIHRPLDLHDARKMKAEGLKIREEANPIKDDVVNEEDETESSPRNCSSLTDDETQLEEESQLQFEDECDDAFDLLLQIPATKATVSQLCQLQSDFWKLMESLETQKKTLQVQLREAELSLAQAEEIAQRINIKERDIMKQRMRAQLLTRDLSSAPKPDRKAIITSTQRVETIEREINSKCAELNKLLAEMDEEGSKAEIEFANLVGDDLCLYYAFEREWKRRN